MCAPTPVLAVGVRGPSPLPAGFGVLGAGGVCCVWVVCCGGCLRAPLCGCWGCIRPRPSAVGLGRPPPPPGFTRTPTPTPGLALGFGLTRLSAAPAAALSPLLLLLAVVCLFPPVLRVFPARYAAASMIMVSRLWLLGG